MIEEQEKRLIQHLQDDDEQAYGELLDHHLPPVSAYVKRMLSTRLKQKTLHRKRLSDCGRREILLSQTASD